MDIKIEYANGMVRIRNAAYTSSSDQIDISAAPGTFIMEVSRAIPTNAPLDSITIWHQSGRRVCSFAASEMSTPSGADVDTLIPLIDAILTQSSGGTSVVPKNVIYVSTVGGSPTGSGSIADPINTITDGIVLAEAAALADGTVWEVRVLPGSYDEQIKQSAGAPKIIVTLSGGVTIGYSGIGGTVDDTDNDIFINLEQGSILSNTGGGAIVSASGNQVSIVGPGTLQVDSNYAAVEVAGGSCVLREVFILNLPSVNEVVNQNGGELRMIGCSMLSLANVATPIIKDGATMKLFNVGIQTLAANYISTSGAESLQLASCYSNVPKGSGITEDVDPMIVDASFTL